MVKTKVFLFGLLSVFLIVSLLLAASDAASVDRKRSTSNVCAENARCGWFVYNKNTRHLEDPHKACECPKDQQCIRTEDDISVSAYVYRCRPISNDGGDRDLS